EKQLAGAEAALENFRVQTITMPTENAAGGAGGQRARDPVFESFFSQKYESDNVQRDRLAVETTLASVQRRQLGPRSLWSVTTAQELRATPTRTTEETRLRREVEAHGALYSMLKNKYEEATLAEASIVPDISILDAPAAPERPTQNRSPYIVLMSVIASIGAA